MSNPAVANRYADALFQLAKEKNELEAVANELELVKKVAESTPQFIQYLTHPKVTNKEKHDFIESTFAESLSKTSKNTLALLIDRKRIDNLELIIKQFQKLAYAESGLAEALVYSAKALTEEEKQQVATTFAKKANKESLVVKNIVDPSLIGGIKIRIGDYIYDGSIRAQLVRLERELIAGTR